MSRETHGLLFVATLWALFIGLVLFGVVWFFVVIRPEQVAAETCRAEHGRYMRTYDGWACERTVIAP